MPCSRFGHAVGWRGPTLLAPVAAPPPDRMECPGGRLVVVGSPLGVTPHSAQWAVILAWAAFDPARTAWACLMVWDGWRVADGRSGRRRAGRGCAGGANW